jgi:trehalose-phosphatase
MPPSALERLPEILDGLRRRRPAVFLDYDGTLTPIVSRPEEAHLDDAARRAVAALARLCPVAVVSGRDLADVRRRVGLEGIWYAGSHGFDIAGPGGAARVHPGGLAARPDLDGAERELREALAGVEGALVERKRFAVAAHYRLVPAVEQAVVARAVDRALSHYPGLRRTAGKMVLELLPGVPWDKGRAVRWLLEALGLSGPGVLPIYLGDDLTDEDAFRELAESGIGIAVQETPTPTAARYRLHSPAEVRHFLDELAAALEGPSG